MKKIGSYVLSLVVAGSVVGCAQAPSDGDPPGDWTEGPGSGMDNPDGEGSDQQQAACGDHVCSAGETSASCPGDCPATIACGDGHCNGNESASTCAQDCTVCGDGICGNSENAAGCATDCAPPPSSCTSSPDNCTADTVCVAGSCVPAYGRVYKLFIASGSVPAKTSSNGSWDLAGGMPDPYVSTFLNTNFVFYTSYKNNTLVPSWNESATVTIASGAKLQLDVYDDDYDKDGYMFSCFNLSLTPDMLRKHGGAYMASCGPSATSTLRFYFQPQ
jgi:hypothetical protein